MIARDEVQVAAARIEGYIRRTPVMRLEAGDLGLGAGTPVEVDVGGIAADSLGSRRIDPV
jgi:hypothetical protein